MKNKETYNPMPYTLGVPDEGVLGDFLDGFIANVEFLQSDDANHKPETADEFTERVGTDNFRGIMPDKVGLDNYRSK